MGIPNIPELLVILPIVVMLFGPKKFQIYQRVLVRGLRILKRLLKMMKMR